MILSAEVAALVEPWRTLSRDEERFLAVEETKFFGDTGLADSFAIYMEDKYPKAKTTSACIYAHTLGYVHRYPEEWTRYKTLLRLGIDPTEDNSADTQ